MLSIVIAYRFHRSTTRHARLVAHAGIPGVFVPKKLLSLNENTSTWRVKLITGQFGRPLLKHITQILLNKNSVTAINDPFDFPHKMLSTVPDFRNLANVDDTHSEDSTHLQVAPLLALKQCHSAWRGGLAFHTRGTSGSYLLFSFSQGTELHQRKQWALLLIHGTSGAMARKTLGEIQRFFADRTAIN